MTLALLLLAAAAAAAGTLWLAFAAGFPLAAVGLAVLSLSLWPGLRRWK